MTFRAAFCYIYGIDPESSYASSMTYDESIQFPTVYHTFDADHREVTLEIPDVNPYSWKIRPDIVNPDLVATDFHDSFKRIANGFLQFYVVNPISGINIDLTGPPKMLVSVSGGEDFDLHKWFPCPQVYIARSHALRNESLEDFEKVPRSSTCRSKLPSLLAKATTMQSALSADNAATSSPADLQAGTAVETSGNAVQQSTQKSEARSHVGVSKPESIELGILSSKYFHFDTKALAAGNNKTIASYSLPDTALQGQARLVYQTGRYFRGDLRFLFTLTTGSFSGGACLVAFVPYGAFPELGAPDYNLKFFSSLPHVIIDYASNKPVELFVPYTYFADYFDLDPSSEMPIAGQLIIWQLTFMQPSASEKPTTMNIHSRWENFKTFVPRPIPAALTAVPLRTKPLPTYSRKTTTMQAALNQTVSSDVASTSDEAASRSAVVPFIVDSPNPIRGSFRQIFARPFPYWSGTVELASGGRWAIDLGLLPLQDAPSVNGAAPSLEFLGLENAFQQFSQFFAAFAGDTEFDIIARCDTTGVAMFVVNSLDLRPIGRRVNDYAVLTPATMKPHDFWPARLGDSSGDGPVDTSYTVGGVPTTSTQVPGAIRIGSRQFNQTRYLPANNRVPTFDQNWNKTLLILEAPKNDLTYHVKLEIYASMSPDARFSHFLGVSPFKADYLTGIPPALNSGLRADPNEYSYYPGAYIPTKPDP
jgi:hypothetical protein